MANKLKVKIRSRKLKFIAWRAEKTRKVWQKEAWVLRKTGLLYPRVGNLVNKLRLVPLSTSHEGLSVKEMVRQEHLAQRNIVKRQTIIAKCCTFILCTEYYQQAQTAALLLDYLCSNSDHTLLQEEAIECVLSGVHPAEDTMKNIIQLWPTDKAAEFLSIAICSIAQGKKLEQFARTNLKPELAQTIVKIVHNFRTHARYNDYSYP